MYFHVIVKDRQTFDTNDYNYCTSLAISGTDVVVTYYDDATLTTPHTATFAFSNFYVYVVPND